MNQIQLCQEIIRNNLADCCSELLEWWNSGILCNGIVRDVSRKLKEIDRENSLGLAERLVEKEAVIKCSLNREK